MQFFNYFPIENEILNIYKELDFGTLPDSDLYILHVPTGSENLMSLSYRYYNTIDDWWIIYFFNKLQDPTFAILPQTVVDSTIKYYVDLYKNYEILDVRSKNKIKECLISYFMYLGNTYTEAIVNTNENLNNVINRSDPVTIAELKDFLNMYIMSETIYSDAIKIPNMQVVFRMRSVMNQKEISWNV